MTNEIELTPQERALMARFEAQRQALTHQMQGAFQCLLAIRNLKAEGEWAMSEDGARLIRASLAEVASE